MPIRNLEPADYQAIIPVIDQWWGGRHMTDMLPKLFFVHFRDTSFAVEERGEILAFLAGFVSQTSPDQAYIHFVGVHPDHRKRGFARQLYERFFQTVQSRGCSIVRCVTSPLNGGSIAFHKRIGFAVDQPTGEHQGVPCTLHYDGPNEHRVLFVKNFTGATLRPTFSRLPPPD